MSVKTISYKRIFYGLEPRDIPQIEELSEMQVPADTSDVDSYLTSSQSVTLDRAFRSLEGVCEQFGFHPLLLDIAVLRDDRVANRQAADNFYVSYVHINTEEPQRVWDAYLGAVRSPQSSEPEYQSIITHKDFYKPNNTVFYLESPEGIELPKLRNDHQQDGFTAAYKFFPNEMQPGKVQSIHKNIDTFIDNLRQKLGLGDSDQCVNSMVMAIPIVRSYFTSRVVPIHEQVPTEGTPGGTLFVFATPDKSHFQRHAESAEIVDLSRALANVMLRGSLSLSYSSIEVREIEEKAVKGAYSFAHPLKGRLGHLRNTVKQLASLLPDELASAGAVAFSEVQNVHQFAEQANLIHTATINGPERLREDKKTRERYMTSTSSLNLRRDVFDQREELYGPRINKFVKLTQIGEESEPHISPYVISGHREQCRLKDMHYFQMFFEIFDNVVKHGYSEKMDQPIEVTWCISDIEFGGSTNQGIVFANRWGKVTPTIKGVAIGDEWRPIPTKTPSGLSYLSHILTATKTGSAAVRIRKDPQDFELALFLNGLTAHLSDNDELT